jgi:hypothetical protein
MANQIIGLSGSGSNIAEVDSNDNLLIVPGINSCPLSGGYYTVAGQTSAVVAAALAANSSLVSMRFSPTSTRRAYITRVRVLLTPSTLGASAGVAGTLGLQRFHFATPSGGTARTANRMFEGSGTTTDMTDIRDNNAALTVTNVVFGTVFSSCLVPVFISNGNCFWEWVVEPPSPLILNAGEGLALRTLVAMAATQTWMYSYTVHWYEK